jgi:hypothetical protein
MLEEQRDEQNSAGVDLDQRCGLTVATGRLASG